MLTPNAKKLVGIIKAAQQYLKMDDETYRSVLVRLTGKDSATRLTPDELGAVRDYFHAHGYPRRSPKKYGRKPNVPVPKKSVLNKIEALLADAGRPWEYAESLAKRMFNRQKIDWLDHDELVKLMQALAVDQKRRRAKA
ncbi:TPA: gp16 family protein [Morganella morganii]